MPDFVVQGGCPKGDGTGGPGYQIKAEFNKQKHLRDSVAMARSQHPDSAGSQFYITYGATPHLDGWILKSLRGSAYYGILTKGKIVSLLLAHGFRIEDAWTHRESAYAIGSV